MMTFEGYKMFPPLKAPKSRCLQTAGEGERSGGQLVDPEPLDASCEDTGSPSQTMGEQDQLSKNADEELLFSKTGGRRNGGRL